MQAIPRDFVFEYFLIITLFLNYHQVKYVGVQHDLRFDLEHSITSIKGNKILRLFVEYL